MYYNLIEGWKTMEKLLYEETSHRLLIPSSFKIYEEKVVVYFWPYKHEIPFSDIREVKIIERIPWYVGWGLRINPISRRLYFAIHHGKSVEIERDSGYWKKIVLSVREPEKFISIFKEKLRK
jgi:hypothetical protein